MATKPCAGRAEDCCWRSRDHVNLESSFSLVRDLVPAGIVPSSRTEARGWGHSCLCARARLRTSFVLGRTPCLGSGDARFGLPFARRVGELSEGVRARRTLCRGGWLRFWGLAGGGGAVFLCLVWFCLHCFPK